jgi:integrase
LGPRKPLAISLSNVSEIREGIKMPENMWHTSIRFKTLCDDILVFSKKHHRDFRSVEIRVKKIVEAFGETPVDKIKPADIDAWLTRATKTPATSNRYRALFSLIFREALRNGKVASNPARLVRQRAENNGRIRFLTEAEETNLRDAIRERFPEHEAELSISLGTGMRLSEQYTLAWKNIDFERREINLDRTKNGSPRMMPNCVILHLRDFFFERHHADELGAAAFGGGRGVVVNLACKHTADSTSGVERDSGDCSPQCFGFGCRYSRVVLLFLPVSQILHDGPLHKWRGPSCNE